MRDARHFLFFCPDLSGEAIELDPTEARHAVAALRCGPGDTIRVTDGAGVICLCEVESTDGGTCLARVIERTVVAAPLPAVHLLVGVPERDGFERLIENVTPLGVASVTPVVCRYCQDKWWAKGWEGRFERLQRKVITGIKQAQSAWLPRIEAPLSLPSALVRAEGLKMVADENGSGIGSPAEREQRASIISCLVGPPGGFAPEECDLIGEHGFMPVALSAHRLRTELAAVVFAAAVLLPDRRRDVRES